MKAFDVRAYSISDFNEWYVDGKLDLSPEFQRRSVWSSTAKAFLADTILKGKPFPKVILMQEFKDGKTVRIVVDGQQRLRAIFDFLNDGIKISRAHSRELAGKTFSQLPAELREEFLTYEVGCDVLNAAPLSELLDIFARINRYTVKLNAQEMRNASFSGFFKSAAYEIGYKFVDHWLSAKILTKTNVNRMSEAELASDLLGCFLVQMQSSKAVDATYRTFEDEEGMIPDASGRLIKAIEFVAAIYDEDEVKSTSWRSKHMYFSLVCCIGHVHQAFDNLENTDLTPESLQNKEKLKSLLNVISADYATYSPQPKRAAAPEHLKDFIRASTLATTDTQARIIRSNYILKKLEEDLVDN
ncbi:DUF262 domain-containing protein [Octadecabacter sp. R77987]|uniref:DUF262 domain-containing protein n=1 Tax=Octadecabacter sp. R77987 TaxID=3093874 RepID=UPI00366D319C